MKKYLVLASILLAVVAFGFIIYYRFYYTKSFSPESTVSYKDEKLEINVLYNRPYKKGRQIFGALVPYGKIWRTGANEATIFETNENILVKGAPLKAGRYTLWTMPEEQQWTIILNSETGQWGIDFNGEANRNPKNDVLTVQVPSVLHEKEIEQFTISVNKTGEEVEMIMLWDKTLVAIPISISGQ